MNSSITTPEMQAAHTPYRLLKMARHYEIQQFREMDGHKFYSSVASVPIISKDSGEAIVRACNSHAALLAVAQSLLYWNDSSTANISDQAARELGPIIAAARAVTENL